MAVARGVGGEMFPYAVHVLSAGAYEVVFFFVVVEVFLAVGVVAESALLLFVEVVVLDVWKDAAGLEVVVVGLAAIAGICRAAFRVGASELPAVVKEGREREGVVGVGV